MSYAGTKKVAVCLYVYVTYTYVHARIHPYIYTYLCAHICAQVHALEVIKQG